MNPDRWALVTGAGRGIGRGIVLELAKSGCNVIVNESSDPVSAELVAGEARAFGVASRIALADVGVKTQVDAMFASLDRVDILVNNAGVQTWKSLLELEEADWDRVLRTNLKGCFLCTQAAGRLMKQAGRGGRIINIGSGCNKIAFPKLVDYTASKGGIEMFTKVSAVELGRYGITVNCVAPGAIETERTKAEAGDYAATWAKATPIGRVGLPEDVGRAVAFLASPAADFISGQTLGVDGGLFARPHWPYE